MSERRSRVLEAVRRSLRRNDEAEAHEAQAAVRERLETAPRGTVPARSQIALHDQVALFEKMAVELAATVSRIDSEDSVPAEVAGYLRQHNLPLRVRLTTDPALAELPWNREPLLEIDSGRARESDTASVTGAFAGVAETGTLLLRSGRDHPTTLAFLPETHIVVLRTSQMVGAYEEAWDRLREEQGPGQMPRTVNFVTGPSRTADIEQTIQLGAHGPRRLHIILVENLEATKEN